MGRKDIERNHRRELLLEAAAQVFGRKPFDEASMQEVSAQAEIGMQGLYEHFASKQELYEQVMLHQIQAFQKRAAEKLTKGGDAVQQLSALAQAYAEHFNEYPMLLPLFIRDRVHFDWGLDSRFASALWDTYATERKRLKTIVEAGMKEGVLLPHDPDYLVQICLAVLDASLYHHHRNAPDEEEETCVNRAMESLLRSVGVRS